MTRQWYRSRLEGLWLDCSSTILIDSVFSVSISKIRRTKSFVVYLCVTVSHDIFHWLNWQQADHAGPVLQISEQERCKLPIVPSVCHLCTQRRLQPALERTTGSLPIWLAGSASVCDTRDGIWKKMSHDHLQCSTSYRVVLFFFFSSLSQNNTHVLILKQFLVT